MRSNNLKTAKLKQNRYLEIHDMPYSEPRPGQTTLPPPTDREAAIIRELTDQAAAIQAEITRLEADIEALGRVVHNRN